MDAPDTSQIREWRSVVTLIVFAVVSKYSHGRTCGSWSLTLVLDTIVSFPFHIPIPVPQPVWHGFIGLLAKLRIIPRESGHAQNDSGWKTLRLSVSTITAPVYGCLFLLACTAIGREEVYDGTIGANHVQPYDVMIFFITLAYIAISIDASGLLKYLAFRVLKKSGSHGRRLYLYLYWFFFAVATLIGNDPIVLSGTAFLAYMVRASSNIESARAWIFSQFAVANISSAILVSSNPTNLVLAGAFQIKFIDYTANMVVPVVMTGLILCPCLLLIVFRSEKLVPRSIDMHTLSDAERERDAVNPNIPHAGHGEDRTGVGEILNPYLDRRHAVVSVTIMAATLVAVLLINAITASRGGPPTPVMYVTVPAALVCFCHDLHAGWRRREETRAVAQRGRTMAEREAIEAELGGPRTRTPEEEEDDSGEKEKAKVNARPWEEMSADERSAAVTQVLRERHEGETSTLLGIMRRAGRWCRETFPAASVVLTRLPFPLVPFAFSMFVLVEALVSRGWVPLFARGWDAWVSRTDVVGAVAGMGFLGVFLSGWTGTNIGTTILLCRILQAWQDQLATAGRTVSDRTFWGAVYSMALGVNFGAFGTVFAASLAGLLWRDILASKGVVVGRLEFLRVNGPIIAIATAVGCAVLLGEIYVVRKDEPYSM